MAERGKAARRAGHLEVLPRLNESVVPKGLIRAGTLSVALSVAREFGVDIGHTLLGFGLDESYFEDAENTLPFTLMGLLMRRCSDLSGCPELGLLAGQRMNASALGTVGFLAGSAPDARTGLACLSRYLRFHNPNATLDVIEDGEHVALVFALLLPHIEGREHILDGGIALAFNTMRKFCGPEWGATEIRLARVRPLNVAPYRNFVGTTIRFNADESAVVFPRKWMNTPLASADADLHGAMLKRIRAMELSTADELASPVRRMLPPLIVSRTASAHVVASLVGLSTRTLNRRLAAEGTTYVRLLEEARHRIALQLLENTDLPANEISDRLGYSQPSAFTRAFERWAGKGPSEWRSSHNWSLRKPPRRARTVS